MKKNVTKVFIILDEDKLDTVKDKNKTICFESQEHADTYASKKIELWTVIKVHFYHKFINHTPNIKKDY